jgi:hypothetical protein
VTVTTTRTGRPRMVVLLAALVALVASGCASSAPTVAPSLSLATGSTGFPTPTARPSGLPTVEPFNSVPPAISAILRSWRAIGVSCGEPQVGMPENKPQWGCQGEVRGVRINVEFVGDDAGMVDMQAQIAAATNAPTATDVFDDLMAATPAFSDQMPAIRAWISAWNGARGLASTKVANVTVSLESDAMWITLSIGSSSLFGTHVTPWSLDNRW